jgi:hypothetical protein
MTEVHSNATNSNICMDNEPQPSGIKAFIAQTAMLSNVIAAAASQKNSSEPLPFTDTSLFEETYGIDLPIDFNPFTLYQI